MFFDDDFALGGRYGTDGYGPVGLTGFDFGHDRFGGSDVDELLVPSRVPGAVYVDDLPDGWTPIENVTPLTRVLADLVGIGEPQVDLTDNAAPAEVLEDTTPDDDSGAAALTHDNDDAQALTFVRHKASDVINDLIADHDPAAADPSVAEQLLADIADILNDHQITVSAPVMESSNPGPNPYMRPFPASLSFLILDTPYVYNDDHLPPSVRPSIDDILGFNFSAAFAPPILSGTWLLGARA